MSVDPPETSKRLKKRLKSSFTFLSDTEGGLLDALNIRVRWTYETETYRQRARPKQVFRAIEQLSRG